MADDLLKIGEELQSKFAKYEELRNLLLSINSEIETVNTYNVHAVGADELGKIYHKEVDDPTKSLDDLVKRIGQLLGKIGINGITTSRNFNDVEHENVQAVK